MNNKAMSNKDSLFLVLACIISINDLKKENSTTENRDFGFKTILKAIKKATVCG